MFALRSSLLPSVSYPYLFRFLHIHFFPGFSAKAVLTFFIIPAVSVVVVVVDYAGYRVLFSSLFFRILSFYFTSFLPVHGRQAAATVGSRAFNRRQNKRGVEQNILK